jgi:hypothetical protein
MVCATASRTRSSVVKTAGARSREQGQEQGNPCHSLLALSHPIQMMRACAAAPMVAVMTTTRGAPDAYRGLWLDR